MRQEKLKEILSYNPETGVFIWKIGRKKAKVGSRVGYLRPDGYREIMVDGIRYLAHRLVWYYVYGYFPENQIDHIDKNKDNNKISNLREVGFQCNQRNTNNFSHNTSGIKGVSWRKISNNWQVRIKINKKQYHIGYFNNFDNAVCARLAIEQCLGWSGCDSNSPAYQYVKEIILCVE